MCMIVIQYCYRVIYSVKFAFRNLVTFIGSLVFMIRLTWKLSAITLVGIPIITMVTHYFGNKFKVSTSYNNLNRNAIIKYACL